MSEQVQTTHRSAGPGESDAADQPTGTLGLWDAVSIIVGIVVGAGIYQTAPTILFMAGSGQVALIAWAIGGVVSLIGALCYAELATTYPRDGGDIVYLSRAFGKWVGFLFGWVQLTVILTGSIGAMAFVFANYAIRLCADGFGIELGYLSAFGFAGGAILLLTVMNVLGVVFGKVIQNLLTLAKIIGLGAIITAGFMAPTEGAFTQHQEPFTSFPPLIGIALVLVLYTYGGWNDAAFVAAEVKNGKKNITRSLLIGILIITVLYMLVNFAYIYSLGYTKSYRTSQIAADVLDRGFGKNGVVLMCVLVMVSSLGAVNGLIFTGARVYATVGKDYSILRWMGGWARERGAPVPALITQGVLALGLVFLVGTEAGRDGMNWLLDKSATTKVEKLVMQADGTKAKVTIGSSHVLPPMNWGTQASDALVILVTPSPAPDADEATKAALEAKNKPFKDAVEGWKKEGVYPDNAETLAAAFVASNLITKEDVEPLVKKVQSGASTTNNLAKDSFDKLVSCTAPIFWVFFLLTGISLFVLRERDAGIERPFKVPLYPELPLIFCLSCGYMLYSSTSYALGEGWRGGVFLLGILPLIVGLMLYRISRLSDERGA